MLKPTMNDLEQRAHPDYKAADAAEVAAVRAGDMNFPGVGCPAALHRPACAAEQVAMALDGNPPILSHKIAHDHGGHSDSDSVASTNLFTFPDGSALQVERTTLVTCTVLTYTHPQRTLSWQI